MDRLKVVSNERNRLQGRQVPPKKPKRPLTGYNRFFRNERVNWLHKYRIRRARGLGGDDKGGTFKAMNKEISSKWASLPQSEKKRYNAAYQAEMVIYKKQIHDLKLYENNKNKGSLRTCGVFCGGGPSSALSGKEVHRSTESTTGIVETTSFPKEKETLQGHGASMMTAAKNWRAGDHTFVSTTQNTLPAFEMPQPQSRNPIQLPLLSSHFGKLRDLNHGGSATLSDWRQLQETTRGGTDLMQRLSLEDQQSKTQDIARSVSSSEGAFAAKQRTAFGNPNETCGGAPRSTLSVHGVLQASLRSASPPVSNSLPPAATFREMTEDSNVQRTPFLEVNSGPTMIHRSQERKQAAQLRVGTRHPLTPGAYPSPVEKNSNVSLLLALMVSRLNEIQRKCNLMGLTRTLNHSEEKNVIDAIKQDVSFLKTAVRLMAMADEKNSFE